MTVDKKHVPNLVMDEAAKLGIPILDIVTSFKDGRVNLSYKHYRKDGVKFRASISIPFTEVTETELRNIFSNNLLKAQKKVNENVQRTDDQPPCDNGLARGTDSEPDSTV